MLIAMLPQMLYNQYGNNAFITLFHIAHFLVREGISNFINRQVPVAERQFITGICLFIYKHSYTNSPFESNKKSIEINSTTLKKQIIYS